MLRFQADVLGYKTVDKLSEEEKAMTAQELMEYLSRAKGFASDSMRIRKIVLHLLLSEKVIRRKNGCRW